MTEDVERPAAQVALAWAMARPGLASTLIGARSVAQLAGNIAAADLVLTQAQMARLKSASAPATGVSAALARPVIRRMVFGGNELRGWGE